jgi:hypothetical protein
MRHLWLKVSCGILSMLVLFYGQSIDTVWVERFPAGAPGGGDPCHSRGHAIAIDRWTGDIYVFGQVWLDFSYGMLLKYSKAGNFIWGNYLMLYSECWEPNAMSYLDYDISYDDPTVAVAGSEWMPGGMDPNSALRTYKCETLNGAILWRARYRDSYGGFAEDVVMDDSGNVYTVGSTCIQDVPPQYYAIIIRYNAEGNSNNIGIIDWYKRVKGNSNFTAWFNFFRGAIWSQGYIYVTGDVCDAPASGGVNLITRKYDPHTGTSIWSRKFVGNNVDQGYKIEKDNAGNIYVAGRSTSLGSGDYGLLVIKYTSVGDTVIGTYDVSGSNFTPWDMAVDSLGNIYVTGNVLYTLGGVDLFIAKFSSNCNLEWIKYYNGPGDGTDQAYGIALDNSGNVYITGETDVPPVGGDGQDYVTIKYNSSGVNCWTVLYDGPGTTIRVDGAYDIAADGSGNLYVTGYSDSVTWDCTTINYYDDPGVGIKESQILNPQSQVPRLVIHPNPFTNKMDIRYQMADNSQKISLKIYDITGQLVRQFSNAEMRQSNKIIWYGNDDNGRRLPPGVYFIQLQTPEKNITEKIIKIE